MGVVVNIRHHANVEKHQIGVFVIEFEDSNRERHSVETKFNFDDFFDFAKDCTSEAFDFLIFSHIVYNVDRAINRHINSIDGWTRNIRINNIPSVNTDNMSSAAHTLGKAISFLTGDYWEFSFVNDEQLFHQTNNNKEFHPEIYKKVALFSGGLDSLIGFVDIASSMPEGDKVLLISHKELGKEGKDQNRILDKCAQKGYFVGKQDRLLLNSGLKNGSWVNKTESESTFRSRSLLFFAMGVYAAHSISEDMPIIVPENGTISLNIPLDKGRRSACSTRTTHPAFINKLHIAFDAMGLRHRFINPYKFKSKADMMMECCEDDTKRIILNDLFQESCSCAKRSHTKHWDRRGETIRHCGMCLPCIYRRVALDAVGWDNQADSGTDVFNGIKYNLADFNQKSSDDFRALLRFLKKRHNVETIRQELLINQVPLTEIPKYVDLAMHSYCQVKDWVAKNASVEIKRLAGIV
jgi:hypothetical protein